MPNDKFPIKKAKKYDIHDRIFERTNRPLQGKVKPLIDEGNEIVAIVSSIVNKTASRSRII